MGFGFSAVFLGPVSLICPMFFHIRQFESPKKLEGRENFFFFFFYFNLSFWLKFPPTRLWLQPTFQWAPSTLVETEGDPRPWSDEGDPCLLSDKWEPPAGGATCPQGCGVLLEGACSCQGEARHPPLTAEPLTKARAPEGDRDGRSRGPCAFVDCTRAVW